MDKKTATMTVPLPSSLTSHVLSIVAEPDPGILARMTVILARLDIMPLQIYSRLHEAAAAFDGLGRSVEIDLYLSSDCAERRDRLVGLLKGVMGVESVTISR
jgi:hypothetical protein